MSQATESITRICFRVPLLPSSLMKDATSQDKENLKGKVLGEKSGKKDNVKLQQGICLRRNRLRT